MTMAIDRSHHIASTHSGATEEGRGEEGDRVLVRVDRARRGHDLGRVVRAGNVRVARLLVEESVVAVGAVVDLSVGMVAEHVVRHAFPVDGLATDEAAVVGASELGRLLEVGEALLNDHLQLRLLQLIDHHLARPARVLLRHVATHLLLAVARKVAVGAREGQKGGRSVLRQHVHILVLPARLALGAFPLLLHRCLLDCAFRLLSRRVVHLLGYGSGTTTLRASSYRSLLLLLILLH
ncbi:hypothetical protein PFISCL1PPCAC_13306, partial [Pristionchus fissidentatus]